MINLGITTDLALTDVWNTEVLSLSWEVMLGD